MGGHGRRPVGAALQRGRLARVTPLRPYPWGRGVGLVIPRLFRAVSPTGASTDLILARIRRVSWTRGAAPAAPPPMVNWVGSSFSKSRATHTRWWSNLMHFSGDLYFLDFTCELLPSKTDGYGSHLWGRTIRILLPCQGRHRSDQLNYLCPERHGGVLFQPTWCGGRRRRYWS